MKIHAWTAAALFCASALSALQAAQAADDTASGSRAERIKAEFESRFKKADRNGDGRLTREEAQAMPRVSAHFDEIDRAKQGSVSAADIAAWAREQKGKRQR